MTGVNSDDAAVRAREIGCIERSRLPEDISQPESSLAAPIAEHCHSAIGQVTDVSLSGEESGPAEMDPVEVVSNGIPVGQDMTSNVDTDSVLVGCREQLLEFSAVLIRAW